MTPVDRADVQGNVLRGYRLDCARYLFARLGEDGLPAALAARTTSDAAWSKAAPDALNVALGPRALQALGVGPEALASAFRAGMAARAGDLRDPDPAGWEPGLRDPQADLLLTVHATSPQALERVAGEVRGLLDGSGTRVVHEQDASTVMDAREHFGFRDGFAQPAFAVDGETLPRPGNGTPERFGRWSALALGELLLGHRDEDGVVAGGGHPDLHDGTFLVWRKLRQDVAGFRRWSRDAARTPAEEELVAAKSSGAGATAGPRALPRPAARPASRRAQRLPLPRRRLAGALPARGPRAARQPARRPGLARRADAAPPPRPAGDVLRPAAARGGVPGRRRRPRPDLRGPQRFGRAPVRGRPAAWCATATRSASATTRTRCSAGRASSSTAPRRACCRRCRRS